MNAENSKVVNNDIGQGTIELENSDRIFKKGAGKNADAANRSTRLYSIKTG